MLIIWLPNDLTGVARSEAVDPQKYHDLQVTLDVRSKEDVGALTGRERRLMGSALIIDRWRELIC
jgi:hypothetical protein